MHLMCYMVRMHPQVPRTSFINDLPVGTISHSSSSNAISTILYILLPPQLCWVWGYLVVSSA